jgi:predicted DNA-binding transcriptional regulator AlpA
MMNPHDLLNADAVKERTGLTVNEINEAIAEQGFPRPTTGFDDVLWHRAEIESWMGKRWLTR